MFPLKNSNFCHFKPIFSGIIPIQFEYCEYIRNKLNFLRFLILIKLKIGWVLLGNNIKVDVLKPRVLETWLYYYHFPWLQPYFFRRNSQRILSLADTAISNTLIFMLYFGNVVLIMSFSSAYVWHIFINIPLHLLYLSYFRGGWNGSVPPLILLQKPLKTLILCMEANARRAKARASKCH